MPGRIRIPQSPLPDIRQKRGHAPCPEQTWSMGMIDRQKLETVLGRRFPGARSEQIASAANAIMGLEDEWEEIRVDACLLAREAQGGTEFRVLRRRHSLC